MSAALVPSTFAIISELMRNTLLLAAPLVTIAVALVVTASTAVLPVIVVTFVKFGAAIYFPYPNIVIKANAFDVEMPEVV
jgi:hypothetical protein